MDRINNILNNEYILENDSVFCYGLIKNKIK